MTESKSEEKKVKTVRATKAKEKSEAANYMQPCVFEVAKLITADESPLMPVLKGNVCEVFINNHLTASTRYLLNHRNITVVDLGVTIELPAGYKINGRVNSKFTTSGLLCPSVYLDEKNRLKFVVINCGPQTPVVLSHGDAIGEIWIEPNLCNWI